MPLVTLLLLSSCSASTSPKTHGAALEGERAPAASVEPPHEVASAALPAASAEAPRPLAVEPVAALPVDFISLPTRAAFGGGCTAGTAIDIGETSYARMRQVAIAARRNASTKELGIVVAWQDADDGVRAVRITRDGARSGPESVVSLPGAHIFELAPQPDGTFALVTKSYCAAHDIDHECVVAQALTADAQPLGDLQKTELGRGVNPLNRVTTSSRGVLAFADWNYPKRKLAVIRAKPIADAAGVPTGVTLVATPLVAPADRSWGYSTWLYATADGRFQAAALDEEGELTLAVEGDKARVVPRPKGLKAPRTFVDQGRSGDLWLTYVAEGRSQMEATALFRLGAAGKLSPVIPTPGSYISNDDLDFVTAKSADWDRPPQKKYVMFERSYGFVGLAGLEVKESEGDMPSAIVWVGDEYLLVYGTKSPRGYDVQLVPIVCRPYPTSKKP